MKSKFRLILFFVVLLLLGAGCKGGKHQTGSVSEIDSVKISKSWLLTDTLLPQKIDLKQDISRFSYQELRLLRSYPYAIHGYHFMEADINAFFSANTNWYSQLVEKLFWDAEDGKGTFAEKYEDVKLTPDEKAFVEKIDKRMAELRDNRFVEYDKYFLCNPAYAVNLFQFTNVDQDMFSKLGRYNFAIAQGQNEQLFHVYEENDYRQVPNFVTTDLFLQAFHMYFSYVLKSLEQNRFASDLEKLCKSLYGESRKIAMSSSADSETKALAEYAAVYYAIPYHLLTGNRLEVPLQYKEAYEEELHHISECRDETSQFLEYTDVPFPYSLFIPRGHYTRSRLFARYFRAMMWLQTAPFCRESKTQLKRAVFMSALLNQSVGQGSRIPLIELYDGIYKPITYLTGTPDNLSFRDIINVMRKNGIHALADALSERSVAKVNAALVELGKSRNRIRPQIEISCRDKINFMPQRYLFDNEVLQDLVDATPDAKRAYPKGLDVFAAAGSEAANDLLMSFYKEPDKWKDYGKRLENLKKRFSGNIDKTASVYNGWLDNLLTLGKKERNHPSFMQTSQWGLKCLNTGLASWAELKHDALLYSEQPMCAECGGYGPPDPIVVGYVEPNISFWNGLKSLLDQLNDVLLKSGCLTEDLKGKSESLRQNVEFLIQVSKKELAGIKLDETEYRTIQRMGSSIEYFTLSVIDLDIQPDMWSLVQGAEKSVAVVADVYTRNVPGCSRNGILHVATGLAGNIYVLVEIEGNIYLTRGATLMYYEFVEPLGKRLTDEEWQEQLNKRKAPSVPEWIKPFLLYAEPPVNNRVFYSSGC